MTPAERAAKIISHQAANHLSWNKMHDFIATQIEEAQREAIKAKCCHCDCHELIEVGDGCFTCIDQRTSKYAEGFRAARDKAKRDLEVSKALLSRLEAAERYCECIGRPSMNCVEYDLWEAWRKAAGK